MKSRIFYHSLLALSFLFCNKTGGGVVLAQNDSVPEAEIRAALRRAGLDGGGKKEQYNYSFFWRNGAIVNRSDEAILLNGVYIKSLIGVDYSRIHAELKKFHAERCVAPRDSFFMFEGRAYAGYRNYRTDDDRPALLSIMDIHKKYAPGVSLWKCLFQINDLLLTDDLTHYRLDEDFLDTVAVHLPGRIETLDGKGVLDVCLIRMYTKEPHMSSKRNAGRTFVCESGDCLVLNPYQGLPPQTLFFVNRQNVGHFAGIDVDSLLRMPAGDYRISAGTLREAGKPLRIVHLESGKYDPDWVSLEEIAARFVPDDARNHCLFLLNGIPLYRDLGDVRIDWNYIHTVYCHKPGEIERLNGGTQAYLHVVEIGCKDRFSRDTAKLYLGLGEGDIVVPIE